MYKGNDVSLNCPITHSSHANRPSDSPHHHLLCEQASLILLHNTNQLMPNVYVIL
jgi:hypothetical protein